MYDLNVFQSKVVAGMSYTITMLALSSPLDDFVFHCRLKKNSKSFFFEAIFGGNIYYNIRTLYSSDVADTHETAKSFNKTPVFIFFVVFCTSQQHKHVHVISNHMVWNIQDAHALGNCAVSEAVYIKTILYGRKLHTVKILQHYILGYWIRDGALLFF